MKSILRIAAAFCLTMAAAGAAHAAPMLRISDGTTTVTVSDGSGGTCGDTIPMVGVVGLSCAIDSWWLNLVLGVGHDVLGDQIHLTSLNVSSSSGGALWVSLTDTDFMNTGANPALNFGGGIGFVSAGSVNYWMYVDDTNTPFGTGALIGSGSGSGAFSNSFSDWQAVSGSYSMTLVAQITHGLSRYSQATSIDFVGRVPEPGTLALLGLAGLGLGVTARRRKL